jgi:hypothetical protein
VLSLPKVYKVLKVYKVPRDSVVIKVKEAILVAEVSKDCRVYRDS